MNHEVLMPMLYSGQVKPIINLLLLKFLTRLGNSRNTRNPLGCRSPQALGGEPWPGKNSVNKRVEMTGNFCKIADNGDLSFTPSFRQFVYVLIFVIAIPVIGQFIKYSGIIILILIAAGLLFGLFRWACQPKIRFSPAFRIIAWKKWFKTLHFPFNAVSAVDVCLDRREYAWSAHLVDRRKRIVEMTATLEIVLENRHIVLGNISGGDAKQKAFLLAQTISNMIGVPITYTGFGF